MVSPLLRKVYVLNSINKFPILSCFRHNCSNVNSFTWRTHNCGELRGEHDGQEVTLCGWVQFRRFDKFLVLKDAYGTIQIIFDEFDFTSKNFMATLPTESVIQVKGIVKKRPSTKANKKLSTGFVEVLAKDVKLLNLSKEKMPFATRDHEKVNEPLKQQYRYLSLRMKRTQEILRTRSWMVMQMRKFLHDLHGFVDVETPTLFKRTPGGAKEFIVPTTFPGRFYSLVQSPQQFKQLLMVGSIDRYFQIARCYRNEGTKANRQPEFTQVDIEVSFTTAEDIRDLTEQLLQYCWPKDKSELKIPFPCITYSEAMETYGTDAPDTRYEIKLHDLTELLSGQGISIFENSQEDANYKIGAISLPLGAKFIKKPLLEDLEKSAKDYGLPNLLNVNVKKELKWDSFLAKHVSEDVKSKINVLLKVMPNDMILLTSGEQKAVNQLLGRARVFCAKELQASGVDLFKTKSKDFSFVWVVDSPLFLKDKTGKIESVHHPFTAPYPEDINSVYSNPLEARSLHYDLVLNGQEIGGGSIRIHDPLLQKFILEEVLKEDSSELQHLLDALESGCPPHGGIALGVDRILAILFGCNSISEVIAFPKSLDGKDLLSGAPAPISEEDKSLYHIEIKHPKSQA